MKPKILIIDDDKSLAAALKGVLEADDYEVDTEFSTADGLARGKNDKYDVVVTDLQLTGPKGLELNAGLELVLELKRCKPQLPVILMTAHHTTDVAIEAIRLGAYDYIFKEDDLPEELLKRVGKAVRDSRLMSEPVELGAEGAMIGNSRAMQNVYKEIGSVAPTSVTVLIQGETGTGKELVARAIHQYSNRAKQSFVEVSCVAIPENLLESEMFGHEKGAFTGAETRRIGRFEQANQGTIFLDEIGDMTLSTQAKLLRVLQEKSIQRLGGKETIPIDVRVVAATHRDLEQAIRDKQFRDDLYYRLHVAVIRLPPLRKRRDDISQLVKFFLHRHGADIGNPSPSIAPEAVSHLLKQDWPGNVRELENVIRKALLMARGYTINLETVRDALAGPAASPSPSNQTVAGYVSQLLTQAICGELQNVQTALTWDIERELYSQAIELARGNQAKAAKWLGVSRPTMREKLRLYGLRSPPESGGN
jgi:DNA-binding NtrC family response regulator